MTPADQSKNVVPTRIAEATLGLTRNTFSAGTHGGGYYFLVTKLTSGTAEFAALCVAGVVLCFLWWAAAGRTRDLMSFWNDCAAIIERAEPGTVAVFSSYRFRQLEDARLTGFRIFRIVIFLMGCTWLLSLAYSFGLLPKL